MGFRVNHLTHPRESGVQRGVHPFVDEPAASDCQRESEGVDGYGAGHAALRLLAAAWPFERRHPALSIIRRMVGVEQP